MNIPKFSFLNGKFNIDLAWNLVSFLFVGVSGVLINLLIIKYLSYQHLGVFNQVFAIYILVSQLAAFGIHLSVQRFVPQFENKKELNIILSSSLYLLFLISGFVVITIYACLHYLGYFPYGSEIKTGTILILPGLFFFTLNKLLLSFLMGSRQMKAYAIFNTLRYIFMVGFLLLLVYFNKNIVLLLTYTEILLFSLLFIFTLRQVSLVFNGEIIYWLKRHFQFGKNAFVGNLLFDVNTKVDILVLGLFVNNEMVGVYSFASTFYEGFVQIQTVIRNNLNSILTKVFYKDNRLMLQKIIGRSIKKSFTFMAILGVLIILCYPVLLWTFNVNAYFFQNWIIFAVLISGSILSSGFTPIILIFNQLNKPFVQSVFLALIFFTNLILNFIFVPVLGIYGSAIGTAIASISQIFFLKYFVKRTFSFSI